MEEQGRYSTGFANIDSLLSRQRTGLVLVAGRPGCAKTAFALNIASNLAKDGQVLFASGELSKDEIEGRVRQLGKHEVAVMDHTTLTLDTLRNEVSTLKPAGLRAVFVDYLQLLAKRGNATPTQLNNDLARLAKDSGLPVFAISQVDPAVDEREDKRPTESDLLNVQPVADVLLCYREAVYNDQADAGKVEVGRGGQWVTMELDTSTLALKAL